MSYTDPEKRKEYRRSYYQANKEKAQENGRKWYEKNKEKKAENKRVWYQANKEKILAQQKKYLEDNKEKRKEYIKVYSQKNPLRRTLHSVKQRCKKNDLPCDLELTDIEPPENCPVFGFKLERNEGGRTGAFNSPSIDRIAPELGYVKGNIQIISLKANMMKQDATPEELRMFARWVLKTFPEEQDGKR